MTKNPEVSLVLCSDSKFYQTYVTCHQRDFLLDLQILCRVQVGGGVGNRPNGTGKTCFDKIGLQDHASLVLTDRHSWCIAPSVFNVLNMNLLISSRSANR